MKNLLVLLSISTFQLMGMEQVRPGTPKRQTFTPFIPPIAQEAERIARESSKNLELILANKEWYQGKMEALRYLENNMNELRATISSLATCNTVDKSSILSPLMNIINTESALSITFIGLVHDSIAELKCNLDDVRDTLVDTLDNYEKDDVRLITLEDMLEKEEPIQDTLSIHQIPHIYYTLWSKYCALNQMFTRNQQWFNERCDCTTILCMNKLNDIFNTFCIIVEAHRVEINLTIKGSS